MQINREILFSFQLLEIIYSSRTSHIPHCMLWQTLLYVRQKTRNIFAIFEYIYDVNE